MTFLPDFTEQGSYLFEPVRDYDFATIQQKWNPAQRPVLEELIGVLENTADFSAPAAEAAVKQFIQSRSLKPGEILPLLRLALAGTMKGPAVFDMAALLGKAETADRLRKALNVFDQTVVTAASFF